MKDLFVDIEALGLRPGYAVIQIGSVTFDRETGLTGPEEFHAYLSVTAFDHVDPDTERWHAEQGTYPHPPEAVKFLPPLALGDFRDWVLAREFSAVWSWGATYDFPLLEAAFRNHLNEDLPWFYWQAQCARTIWNLAFPGVKHAPRPHHALEDCLAGVRDLHAALRQLTGKEIPTDA